jgi:hypothetical protein
VGDVLPTLVVLVVGAALAASWARGFPRREARLLMLSFVAHVFAAFAQIWITRGYYGIGDMLLYHETGVELARLIRYDPVQFVPDVVSIVFHGDPTIPVIVIGQGGPSGVTSALAGLLCSFLGDSLYAVCVVFAIATFFGKGALYRALRESFHPDLHVRVLVATMLVPSVIFWSSALLKEPVAIMGFGWVVLGWHRYLGGRRIVGLAIGLLGAVPVALVKPYILMALFIALGVWWYWRRGSETSGTGAVVVKPIYFVLGAAGALGAIVLLGELFPRYALDNIGEETARMQGIGTMTRAGSNYEIGDASERSVAGQLAFAPLGLLTALFRPFIFEVRNIPMAVNALETTALTLLFAGTVIRRSWARVWLEVQRGPALMMALTFTIVFGVAVGLATTNLGTLSRYRIPLVPFFATFVLVLAARKPSGAPAQEARPAMMRTPPRRPLRR